MRSFLKAVTAALILLPAAVQAQAQSETTPDYSDRRDVVRDYADRAHIAYEYSRATAVAMAEAIDELLADPSDETLKNARDAWWEARYYYQETEVHRFGNPIVDAWEGKVNAWPLDEGLIDYVDVSYGEAAEDNPYFRLNIIANPVIQIDGEEVDTTELTADLLASVFHEAGGVETNVATGYHAIEFLLWGQDLHSDEKRAGERPATDYSLTDCSNDNCDRRRAYLKAATDLLISDLEEMVAHWAEDGAARAYILEDTDRGLSAILTGMGSLSFGELAGERIKLGLLTQDPEEEHDCFSDNTAWSHYQSQAGISGVFYGILPIEPDVPVAFSGGEFHRGIWELLLEVDEDLADRMEAAIDRTDELTSALTDITDESEHYDQMLVNGNSEGRETLEEIVEALVAQTREIERAFTALGLEPAELEGSDSLTNPESVFQ